MYGREEVMVIWTVFVFVVEFKMKRSYKIKSSNKEKGWSSGKPFIGQSENEGIEI